MKKEALARLRCPYCWSRLQPSLRHPAEGSEIESAILACACGEFPLLGGIPIFRREGRVDIMQQAVGGSLVRGPTVARLLALIRSGAADEALAHLLAYPEPWLRRSLVAVDGLPRRLRARARPLLQTLADRQVTREQKGFWERVPAPTARDAFDSWARQTGKREHFYHFYHRFGQPRHLSGLALTWILPRGPEPSLDLACGFGHTLHHWMASRPTGSFFGLDRNFFSLYVAKRWVAPRAEYVCASADERLPFSDGALGAILCEDAFHNFLRKKESAAELRRVLKPDGVLALSRFGNALVEPREGYELDPDGYARLFEGFPVRFLADPAVLAGYVSGRLPNLEDGGTPGSVASTKWISLVASRSPAAFRDYGPIGEWPHGLGRLGLNPLYRSIPRAGGLTLQLELPTEWFAFENAECRSYMPERIDVARRVLEDLAAQRRTPEVEELIRQCVVLGLPESYG